MGGGARRWPRPLRPLLGDPSLPGDEGSRNRLGCLNADWSNDGSADRLKNGGDNRIGRGDQCLGSKHQSSTGQITVLYDAFGKTSTMTKDWGFAALVEYGGNRILFDTGNNAEVFAHNVGAKGVDLTQLDFAIVSHRHGDHTSGLNHLLKVNPAVEIYAPQENFGVFGAALPSTFYKRNESLPADMRYFDGKPPDTLRFGTPWPEANFTWITKTTEVAPGFHLILQRRPRIRSISRYIWSWAALTYLGLRNLCGG